FSSILPLPPISTLFPYTTLFRSRLAHEPRDLVRVADLLRLPVQRLVLAGAELRAGQQRLFLRRCVPVQRRFGAWQRQQFPEHRRSEEHTSELQSLTNIVCRLLPA